MTINFIPVANVDFPAPYFSQISTPKIANNINSTLEIEGSFFTPNMTVQSGAFSINSFDFISDNKVILNVSTTSILGQYNILFNNGTQTTATNAIEIVELGEWIDLRSGGTPLDLTADVTTTGVAQEIIRTSQGMTLVRNNVNFPQNSLAESLAFEKYKFKKGNNTTVEIVFYNYPGEAIGLNYMVGLGKNPRNLNSTTQFFETELVLYFDPPDFIGFYGDRTFSSFGSINNITTTYPGYLKVKFTNDLNTEGRDVGQFFLYSLPTVEDEADWNDESNLISSGFIFSLGGGFAFSGEELFPILLPKSGAQNNVITAFRLT
ncbi:MAG: hypothetical protein QNJ54_16185 [Prochloraceae cyanobacterium]|nr:hypothetical protein [Prochloraceae cyanobacterium]